jgi:hypothetical protein
MWRSFPINWFLWFLCNFTMGDMNDVVETSPLRFFFSILSLIALAIIGRKIKEVSVWPVDSGTKIKEVSVWPVDSLTCAAKTGYSSHPNLCNTSMPRHVVADSCEELRFGNWKHALICCDLRRMIADWDQIHSTWNFTSAAVRFGAETHFRRSCPSWRTTIS